MNVSRACCLLFLGLLPVLVLADTYYEASPRLFGWGWGGKEKEVTVSKGWGWKKPSIKGVGIYGGIRVHHKDPGGGGWGWGGGWGLRLQQGWGSIKGEEGGSGGGGGGHGGGGGGEGWGWGKKKQGWGGGGGGGGHGHGGGGGGGGGGWGWKGHDDDDDDDGGWGWERSLPHSTEDESSEEPHPVWSRHWSPYPRKIVSSIESGEYASSEVNFGAPVIYEPVFYHSS